MNLSLVGVVLLATLVVATPPVNDDELTSKILKRASRSIEGNSFINILDNFLFLFQQGTSSVGSELLNNVLFTLDFVTPSFDYVMDSVYGRGYRLNENYKKYVQMYMTEDQIADHNHLMKIFKEDFGGDYDRYLQSGLSTSDLYGTTQPISQNALDYLGRTISGNFPPGQQYTQQQLARGVASVLQGFDNIQNPSAFYFPQQVQVPVPAPSQQRTPDAPGLEKLPPNSGWQQDPNGDWFYITYLRNIDIPPSDDSSSNPPIKAPGRPPYGSYEYLPSPSKPQSPRSYTQSSGQPRAQSPTPPPPSSYIQSPLLHRPDPRSQMYSKSMENRRIEPKSSGDFPYEDYVISPPRFPPPGVAGENFPSQQRSSRPGSLDSLGQAKKEFKPQTSQEQSSYTSYEMSDADASRSDLSKMYPPAERSSDFQQNETGKTNAFVNTEGIPENFLDGNSGKTQAYSIPKSRKKRLADLYQSDLPPKILFCPPENLKLLLCAGDIAMDTFLIKPVLYVLSWFI